MILTLIGFYACACCQYDLATRVFSSRCRNHKHGALQISNSSFGNRTNFILQKVPLRYFENNGFIFFSPLLSIDWILIHRSSSASTVFE